MDAARRMLTEADREEISRGIAEERAGTVIAARIGRCPSVVSREITRHGGRVGYRRRAAGPRRARLDADPVLREQVVGKLRAGCSPDQVAGRLRREHGGDHAARVADTVSHEAIYTWIYALPKASWPSRGSCCAAGAPSAARAADDRVPAPGSWA